MPENESEKLQAAVVAAGFVGPGMRVGLGTGSTAKLVVARLGERWADEGLRFVGVATSEATAAQARALGIELQDLDGLEELDLDIDGADEVDPQFRLIKGRGGALLREKIVAAASRRRIIVVTPSKQVERLGATHPVPVEVSPFGIGHVERSLKALGARTAIRYCSDGSPFVTDGGHWIIDCQFGPIEDPVALNRRLNEVVGVFETGLFVGLCDLLVVGHADGVELLECPESAG